MLIEMWAAYCLTLCGLAALHTYRQNRAHR